MDAGTELTDARLDIGGNNPPKSELERHAALMATVNAWIASRPEIEDSDEAAAAQGFADQARTLKKDLAAAQKVELAPHEVTIAEVKAKYRGPLDLLETALKSLLDMSGAWLVKERARVAAVKAAQEEEARRLRDEAARLERESQEAARHADTETVAAAATLAAEAATTAKAAEKVAEKKPEKIAIKSEGAARAMPDIPKPFETEMPF